MGKKYNQINLTRLLAEQAKMQAGSWQSLRQTLWFKPTDNNSLRLTYVGYNFFKRQGFTSYEITLENKGLANKHLLILERYYPGVYMLVNAKKIILFDEEYASLIILMNGDIMGYLENLEKSIDNKSEL